MSTGLTIDQALQALAHPGTDAGTLQAIATQFPALRAQVAAHPQCYPALGEWIAAQAPVVPAAPVIPAAPVQPPATVQPALAVQPAAPAIPAPPLPLASPGALVPLDSAPVIAPTGTTAKSGSKVAMIVAGATVGVVAIAAVGGAVVYNKVLGSDGGAMDSAKALPASTVFAVELSIEPSTQQKLTMAQVFSRMDGIQDLLEDEDADATSDLLSDPGKWETNLRPYLWEALVEDGDLDTDLDYDKDIAPWLGGRLAVGGTLVADSPEHAFFVAIESKNDVLGVAAVEQLLEDSDTEDVEVTARNGYIFVHSDELDLDDAFADGVLADQPSYTSTVPHLGDRGLVSVWYSPHASLEAMSTWLKDVDPAAAFLYGDAADQIDPASGSATVVRVVSEGLDIINISGHPFLEGVPEGGNAVALLGDLPDSTAIAFSVLNLGSLIDHSLNAQGIAYALAAGQVESLSAFDTSGGSWGSTIDFADYVDEMENARDEVEDALGLSLDTELDQAIGRGVVFALDEDLGCDFNDYNDECEDVNMALLLHGPDTDRAADLVEDLLASDEADEYGVDYSELIDIETSDDGTYVVVGRGDYVDTLSEKSSRPLSQLPEFTQALPDTKNASAAFFVRTEGILSMLKDLGVDPGKEARNAIEDFAALGYTVHYDNGVTTMRLRIVIAS